MKAAVVTCHNPFDHGQRRVAPLRRRRRIRACAPRGSAPVIAYLNGRVILRNEWRRRVADGDVVTFVVLPLGGGDGGKNPLALVLSIALMAVTGPMATAMLGAELAGTAIIGELTIGKLVAGAIGMVGNALISSAFAGKPAVPSAVAAATYAAPSPTYNLAAQGNMARVDAAIPVQYGRMLAYPDFAAQPYAEYSGNEQYLFQLLCLGQGEYEIEAIRIDDTSIDNYDDITTEIIGPGDSLTLFPANVASAAEVSGQTAEYSVALGPFTANAAGTTANALAFDVVAGRGLYYANDSGGLDPRTVTFTCEARSIDDDGDPLGDWVVLGTETISGATATPQRYSYRYTGLSGRYEARLTRTSTAGGSSRYADEIAWSGLRAYLPDTRTWPGLTLIALRMRASNSLSGLASRKINVIATRKLPIWNGSAWTAPQVTRSPAWAMADVLRADYGGGMADARVDIDQLVTLAATYAARGDTFDARFDNSITLWEALQRIGQAVRTRPYLQGGIVHFVRDEAQTVPAVMFSMRNIVRGSFRVDYLMPTAETADVIDVRFFDGDVWASRPVLAALPGSSSAVPYKVELFGVTNREQAYREGLYLAAVNRYRRKRISFVTEMEGYIPSFGDLITVSHDMPAWGVSGEVVAVETITASPITDYTLYSDPTRVASASYGPGGETLASVVTDDSAVNWEYLAVSLGSIVAAETISNAWFVKKDAVSARFLIFRLLFTGGTGQLFDIAMRSDTGAASTSVGATGSVTDFGDYWRVDLAGVNGNNTAASALVFVAGGSSGFTYDATATGSATLWAGDLTILELSEPVTFSSGNHYIGLRTRGGGVSGPWLCTAGATPYQVAIAGALDFTPYTGGAEERTHFAFGLGETWRQPARVMNIRPRGVNQVEIEAVNEDDSIHTADSGATAPAAQYSALPSLFTAPIVAGLTVKSKVHGPTIAMVSWRMAPGARSYLVEASADGDTWSRVDEPTANNSVFSVPYGNATLIRVAAMGMTRGPWVQVSYAAVSGLMWNPVDTTLMWDADDTTLMWS